ncbi:MAG: hypothetical protein S4CHLAM2_08630 [Chlamydiales bacterium]|nr:hypothetical protein [Chlamydiales bacterium]
MLEELVPLAPVHFFQIQADCLYGKRVGDKHVLPDLSALTGQKSFAYLFLAWNEGGVRLRIEVEGSFTEPDFPNFQTADSIELFFDTRDVKTSGFNTRFCHHFYFLPIAVQNNGDSIQAGEVTRFRTEDRHELCDASQLEIKKVKTGKFDILIPAECLHGYDPSQFNRLGFTYRINRINGASQIFSAHDEDFSIEQQPSLWASLVMTK